MNLEENAESESEYFVSEIFGWQKVKLYKIKHFIFDFGGVMIEKTFTIENLFELIAHDLKVRIPLYHPKFKKYRRRLSSGIISAREFLEKIFDIFFYPFQKKNPHLPQKKVNVSYYLELWFHLYSLLTNLSSEMEEIVERLHKAGFTVSLLSNTFDIHARSNELNGFYNIFDHVFLSNEIGYRKPQKEKYIHVLKKLEAKPKNCVFIDDKLRNLIPARELGIIVIKFESIKKFKKQLNELGIKNINPNLKETIRNKYKQYKKSKKEYKRAKKAYRKAKKEFFTKEKKKTLIKKKEYQKKQTEYRKKKIAYEKHKEIKKEQLTAKIRIEDH
ncbi:MAG: HAD-IA family hydrolase [Candidatus Lokiarchaeota archaeon]|nr:HAD-IA family hydrolase [Candidatus Lokiarchaeota archaeon]